MNIEHRGRKAKEGVKEAINGLVQQGFSYSDIAKTLNLKSRQLVRYHFLRYRKLSTPSKKRG